MGTEPADQCVRPQPAAGGVFSAGFPGVSSVSGTKLRSDGDPLAPASSRGWGQGAHGKVALGQRAPRSQAGPAGRFAGRFAGRLTSRLAGQARRQGQPSGLLSGRPRGLGAEDSVREGRWDIGREWILPFVLLSLTPALPAALSNVHIL